MATSQAVKVQQIAPYVSIVMPVYNGEKYLPEAIESILAQTFYDFEYIIIDDGSADNTWAILTHYADKDSRIHLIRNQQNLGIIQTLNKGVSLAQGKYIARMDADDISLPERIETQVKYLEDHTDIGIIGTAYFRVYADTQTSLRCPPLTDLEIRWHLLFGNIWCHPSIMFRRQLVALEKPFYRQYLHAEDYELWVRLLRHTQGASLSKPLLQYRVHQSSICSTYAEDQERMVTKLSVEQIEALTAGKFSLKEIEGIRRCYLLKQLQEGDVALYPLSLQLFEIFVQQHRKPNCVVKKLRRQWIKKAIAILLQQHGINSVTLGFLWSLLRSEPILLLSQIVTQLPAYMLRQVTRAWHVYRSGNERIAI